MAGRAERADVLRPLLPVMRYSAKFPDFFIIPAEEKRLPLVLVVARTGRALYGGMVNCCSYLLPYCSLPQCILQLLKR